MSAPERHAYHQSAHTEYGYRCICGRRENHEVHGARIEAELPVPCLRGQHVFVHGTCANCQRTSADVAADLAAGDAATDVDSTAEVCEHARALIRVLQVLDDWSPMPEFAAGSYLVAEIRAALEPSAGSPVTAGVPDTTRWRDLAADWAVSDGYIRNALEDACDRLDEARMERDEWADDVADAHMERTEWDRRLTAAESERDAARGELVTARGERDALLAELAGVTPEGVEWQYRPWIPPAQRTADDWSSMVAVARNRAWAAEAERDEAVRLQALEKSAADSMARKVNELRGELAAANARIAAVEALCESPPPNPYADAWVDGYQQALSAMATALRADVPGPVQGYRTPDGRMWHPADVVIVRTAPAGVPTAGDSNA